MNRKNLLIIVSVAVGLGAMAFSGTNISAETAPDSNKMGDVNGDAFVDSVDASMILAEYTKNSTGGNGTFTDVQKKSANINKDNFVDSVDASLVLGYYAFISTGGQSSSIESWYETTIHNPSDTTTTTTIATQTTATDDSTTTTTTTVTSAEAEKISEIKLTKYEMSLQVGEKDISYVTMLPEAVANKDEIWTTSDEKVATVDAWGNVTAVGLGECIITVTSVDNPSVKAEIKVKVTDPNRISEIKLDKYEMNLKVTEKDIAYVTMLPETVANKEEVWTTSDEKVATVDAWGNVTAVGMGECVVTVTSVDNPSVKAEIKVKVTDPNRISEIKLDKYEMNLKVTEKDIAYVTMLPETVANKEEVWTTSDEKVATVDAWGNVTAVGMGECVVTVTSVDNPSVKAEIKVKVTDPNRISEIKLDKYEMNFKTGEKDIAYVTMLPETVANKDEVWTTSDEKVATVDAWGNVTAVGLGECIVTVTSVDNPSVKAEIKVKVTDPNRISEIKLDKYEMNFKTGEKDIAYVTMLPETVANKEEVWTTSDEKVATVDAWGNVTAVGLGECIVTVTSVDNPSVKAEIKVKVTDPNRISEIKLSKYEMNFKTGEKDIAYVTMLPETVANKEEVWTTSDEKVATVDAWGNVTAVGLGECIVTVTSVDNPSVKAEIKVKVIDPNRISEIKLDKYEMNLKVTEKDIA
ncbi:MAG: Ig-like domain-containing protein, partial [Ruminococcus sp.]|nr:Ig-like domain-containing protein [Ruminococcus sp.]